MWLIDQLYIKMGVYLNLGYTILIEQLKIKEAILISYFYISTLASKKRLNQKKNKALYTTNWRILF